MELKPKRNQILVPVPMRQEFIDEIGQALQRLGYSNRADFIRDAIVEKLKNEGESIDPAIAAAPSRMGKGGRPQLSAAAMNDKPSTPSAKSREIKSYRADSRPVSSKPASVATKLLKKVSASVVHPPAK